ncbi:MAG TPA: ATP-binding protein [Solirubrobacteraceae bacterium]|nr:ATP-binding protein [Solirubrobacteraceae bacterium]
MAVTGSDRPPRSVRLTLRLRLTLLYGGVLIAAGAGLLAVTYGLFKHNQGTQSRSVSIRGVEFAVPSNAARTILTVHAQSGAIRTKPGSANNAPVVPERRGAGGSTAGLPAGTGLPKTLLKQIQESGQTQLLALARRANVNLRTQESGDASALLEWSGIALGVVALLSIGLAWWLAGRALRPLRTMNTRAREISAENLHERLGVEGRRDELGELATTFDALLTRLETSFESQRRFVANASHELRTPITLERTLVEVALADPEVSVASLRRVCERVVASTEEQERLLDALLTLARSEAGVATGESVDLVALVEDALLAREGRLERITVEVDLKPAVVIGDQALLERLVANLLDNAIVHNRGDERWINVSTGESEGGAGLRIANSGEVVELDRVPELFEPFRRGVGDRVGGRDGGLGLGLSIVRAVAAAHAARIEGRALPGGGLEFELRFASDGSARPPVGGLETVTLI